MLSPYTSKFVQLLNNEIKLYEWAKSNYPSGYDLESILQVYIGNHDGVYLCSAKNLKYVLEEYGSSSDFGGAMLDDAYFNYNNIFYEWVKGFTDEDDKDRACLYIAKTVNRFVLSKPRPRTNNINHAYSFSDITGLFSDYDSLPLKEAFLKTTSFSTRSINKGEIYSFADFDENISFYSNHHSDWENDVDKADFLKWFLMPKENGEVSIQVTPHSYTQVGNPEITESVVSGIELTEKLIYFKGGNPIATSDDGEKFRNQIEPLEKYALEIQEVSKYSVLDMNIDIMLERLKSAADLSSLLTNNSKNPKSSLSYKLVFNIVEQKTVVVPSVDMFQAVLYLKAMGSETISLYYDAVEKRVVIKGKDFESEVTYTEKIPIKGSRFFDTKKVVDKVTIPTFSIIYEQPIDELTAFTPIEYVEFFNPTLTFRDKYELLNTKRNAPLELPEEFIEEYPSVAASYEQQADVGISLKSREEKYDYVERLINEYLNSYTQIIDGRRETLVSPDWEVGNYVLKVNEAYWNYNSQIDVEELLAFFVSKGNDAGFRMLSLKILGVDYHLFEQPIINSLLESNDIYVSKLEIDESNVTAEVEYEGKNSFISGNIYDKKEHITKSAESEYSYNKGLGVFFGSELGSNIYDKALTTIDDAIESRFTPALVPLVKDPKEVKALELNIDISCPIFFKGQAQASTSKNIPNHLITTLLNTGSSVNHINMKYGHYGSKEFKYGHYELFNKWLETNTSQILGNYTYEEIRDCYIYPYGQDEYTYKYVFPFFKDASKNIVGFLTDGTKDYGRTLNNIENASETTKLVLKELGYIASSGVVTKQEAKEIKKKFVLLYKARYWAARREGRRLFNEFLRKAIDNVSRQLVDKLWNKAYNNYAKPELVKVPMFPSHSYKFGKREESKRFNLMDAQKEGVRHVLSRENSGLFLHEVGFGKGSLLTSNILTPKGYVKMRDIKVGSLVIGVDGKPTKVKGVYPLGEVDCYKVTFNDGSFTEVSNDHLWKVQTINYRGKYKHKWDILETEELIRRGLYNVRNDYQYSIPMVSPVEFERQELPLHPYLMGVILGDGCISDDKSVGISNPESEIIERISELLPNGVSLKKQKGDNVDYRITRDSMKTPNNPVVVAIKKLGLTEKHSHNKFIPEIYKVNSIENRLEILRGLLDTDGTIQKTKRNGNSTIYCTTSEKLAEDVKFLVESFGGTVSINTKTPTYTYKGEKKEGRLAYMVTIRLPHDIVPFYLSRKVDAHIPKTKYQPIRFIASIEPIGKEEAQCIAVEHPEHLYCCENFIVTHNTTTSITAISSMMNTGEANRVLFMVPNSVYDKFQDEIVGNEEVYGLLPNVNIVLLDNLTKKILTNQKPEKQIKVFTKHELDIIDKFRGFDRQFNKIIAALKRGRITFPNDPAFVSTSNWDTAYAAIKRELKKHVALWDKLEILSLHIEHLNEIYNTAEQEFNDFYSEQQAIIDDYDASDSRKKSAAKDIKTTAEKFSNKLSKNLKSYVQFINVSLVDDLGVYTEKTMAEKTILIAKHSAVETKLRPSKNAVLRALMFKEGLGEPSREVKTLNLSEWSDITGLTQSKCAVAIKVLTRHPISLERLNIDAVVVDEIHNFNNIVNRAGTKGWEHSGSNTYVRDTAMTRKNRRNTEYFSLEKVAGGTKNRFAMKYDSTGRASDQKGSKLTAAAICFDIQYRSEKRNNVLLLSATPFTDTPFQVVSVLGMANYSMLQENGIESAWDFFNNYVDETYKYDLRHDGAYGLFIDVNGYYNDKALSNLITNVSNVKITDEKIEATRPKKAIVPANKMSVKDGEGDVVDTTNNMGDVFEELENVSSRVELSENQEKFQEIIREYITDDNDQRPIKEIFPINEDRITKIKADVLAEEIKELVEDKIEEANANPDYADLVVSYLQSLYDKGKYAQHPDLKDAIDHITIKVLKGSVDKPEEDELEAVAADTSQMSTVQRLAGKAIGVQQAQQALVISPYFVNLGNDSYTSTFLPDLEPDPATVFVEQSPKLMFVVESIKQTIEYQKKQLAKGEIDKIGGQVVYFDKHNFGYGGKKYNSFELLAEYIARNVGGISEDKDPSGDYVEVATIDGGTKIEDSVLKGSGETKRGRTTIKDSFNDGRVKILIGSKAIKEGIDLQGNSHTMYICEAEFSPEVAMQLEGRIWRQKNPYDVVRVVYVLAMNTIDSFVYSKINRKVNMIKRMLELGVYEMNTTQFVIDTKEMLIQLETNPDKLTEIQYQDEITYLTDEVANLDKKIDRLRAVKDSYEDVEREWDIPLPNLNKLYGLLSEARESYYKNSEVKKEIKKEKSLQKIQDYESAVALGYKKAIDEWQKDKKSSYDSKKYEISQKEINERYLEKITKNPKLNPLPKLKVPISIDTQYSEIEKIVIRVNKALLVAENIERVWRDADEEEQQTIRDKENKSAGELNWIAYYDTTENYDLSGYMRRLREIFIDNIKSINIIETYQSHIKNEGKTLADVDSVIEEFEAERKVGADKIGDELGFKVELRAQWVEALAERKETSDGSISGLVKSMADSLPLIRLRTEEEKEILMSGAASKVVEKMIKS